MKITVYDKKFTVTHAVAVQLARLGAMYLTAASCKENTELQALLEQLELAKAERRAKRDKDWESKQGRIVRDGNW